MIYRLLLVTSWVVMPGIDHIAHAAYYQAAQVVADGSSTSSAFAHTRRCGTIALLARMRAPDAAPSAARPDDGPRRTRPTIPGEAERTGGFGHTYTETPTSYLSPGGRFRIWYVTGGSDRPGARWPGSNDADNNGVPDWVERCAEFFDQTWQTEIDLMGYRTPPVDFDYHDQYVARGWDDGGDGRYDVYIQNVAAGIAGYTNMEPVIQGRRLPSYIVVDNDLEEVGTVNTLDDAIELLKATVAHEFMHAIQFGYDFNEDIYWIEQSAVWMEEQVFSEVNDYVNYLNVFSGFLTEPWLSLDTQNGQFEFAGVLWPLYLSQRFDQAIVLRIWEEAETVQSLDAMERALQMRNSSLKAAFQEFTVWNVFTNVRNDPTRYYSEGATFPGVVGTDTTDAYPFSGPDTPLNKQPSHLGANYLFFFPDPLRAGGLRIDFSGLTGEWGVSAVGVNITGPDTVITVPLASQQGVAEVPDWNRFDVIVLAVASLNRTGFNYSYQYTATYDSTLVRQIPPDAVALSNFPNPFILSASTPETRIRYSIPVSGQVVIRVFNIRGQEVRTLVDQNQAAGQFEVAWNGTDSNGRKVASGVYFCRLSIMPVNGAPQSIVRKMVLVK